MRIKHFLPVLLAIALIPFSGLGQVTTSSITGTVKTNTGEDLEGATVTAVHLPTGSEYVTLSKKGGVFILPNIRIGGPYTVTINYVGYKAQTFEGINLLLGEPFSINVVMGEDVQEIDAVVVTGRRRVGADRTGAATNIGQRQITTLPTVSRSLTDFTRLTPQSNGNNFAGKDGRFNNLQVDGANLNNNFGLSNDLLPGGQGNQPISLDAIEEVSVNIAPFDVRQAGFTGAGINAVTKSGTNTFRGSAYTYYRDQSFNGRNVGDSKLPEAAQLKNTIYGGTLGGPIIKNKLFFFVNAELEERITPGIQFYPAGGSGTGNESSTHVDSLRKLSDHLRQKYGYETGAYENFPNFTAKNHKILGRIDWNISSVHKLTLKYNEMVSNNDVTLNATSVPNGGGFTPTGASSSISRMPNNRFGLRSFSFANSNYGFKDVVKSGALELNSNFGRFSNQFLATLTKINATRTSPSAVFPFVDIMNNDGLNYMSFGYEPYSYNNDVVNDVVNVINNFSYYAGKHSLTGGVSYEYQRVGNMFMAGSQSYYVFSSLDDFIQDRAPAYYAYTYSLVPGKDAVYSAELKLGQLGLYAQDEITVNDRMKVTIGLRADRPVYHEQPIENPSISALQFPDKDGNMTSYNTGAWPASKFYWSPRVGFRWDTEGDKNMVIRGGTGIFTGRIPFVWFTNMPTNSGMYQFGTSVTNPADLQNYTFDPNPAAYRNRFPSTPGGSVPSNVVLIDPDFKFPQIWRTNLAFDKNLGKGITLTMEALYTKELNAVAMRNANQTAPTANFNGSDTRARYIGGNAQRRLYPNLTSAVVLENTNKGNAFSFTTQLSKNFTRGFYGAVAYTYTLAQEVTANPGSQASSVWNANPTTGTQNDLQLAYTAYAVPHRVIANLSYRFEYLNHLATTISLFYEGAAQGNFSYVYGGDLNNDGNNNTDLMYIPKGPSDINFVDQAATSSLTAYTAAQQSEAFFRFVENSKYLSKNQGNYAERNGAFLPWYNRLDMKILQDIFTNIGERKHTLQVSVDILNAANLINKNWGLRNQTIINNPLIPAGVNAQGEPQFRMAQIGGQLPTEPFQVTRNNTSTWGLQVGLRYIF